MDTLTDTQLRQIEQHRIKQLEMLDTRIMRRRMRLLPRVKVWDDHRAALLLDLAGLRSRLAKAGAAEA